MNTHYELSDIKRVKLDKGVGLRFTFTCTIENVFDADNGREPMSFSLYGCLAGVNHEGRPWCHPPRNNGMKGRTYEVCAWNKALQDYIIQALWDVGLSEIVDAWKLKFKADEMPDGDYYDSRLGETK